MLQWALKDFVTESGLGTYLTNYYLKRCLVSSPENVS
jgi:hypothetical protein